MVSSNGGARKKMKITSKKVGDVMVLEASGKIVGDDSLQMRREVAGWIGEVPEDQKLKIVLKLNGVSMMDSAGIGALVSSYTTVQKRQGRLVLAGLGRGLQNLITITQLAKIFDVYETEEQALSSFEESK
jgi:anti-sigma B factor antagonist